MAETMEKIKSMVDMDTTVGTPIATPDGATIIQTSSNLDLVSGGSDYEARHARENTPLCFGGGGGAGVTVTPICFLVISPTEGTHVVGINAQAVNTADRLVEMIPEQSARYPAFLQSETVEKLKFQAINPKPQKMKAKLPFLLYNFGNAHMLHE